MPTLERSEVAFALCQPGSCLVDPVRPSGYTESGIYVYDQENQFASQTSMFVRVVGLGPDCGELQLGGVYLCPVYCWEDMPFEGEKWHVTHKANLHALVDGYDTECATE